MDMLSIFDSIEDVIVFFKTLKMNISKVFIIVNLWEFTWKLFDIDFEVLNRGQIM